MTVVKFKKLHPNAVAPVRANPLDAGWDLTALSLEIEEDMITYDTGISVAIPEGNVGLIFQRSSVYKKDLLLSNAVGVIDAGYRGPIKFKFRILKDEDVKAYAEGDRIGQLIIIPILDVFFDETSELPESVRGEGGFGSSKGF